MTRRSKSAPVRRSRARPETLTILVVDDEPLVRGVLRRRLELAGYDVVEAAEGAAALERCRERRVSLVLTDLLMPGVSGVEFVELLREEFPAVPVIAFSGAPGQALVPMLTKPFTTPQLLEAVRSGLQS